MASPHKARAWVSIAIGATLVGAILVPAATTPATAATSTASGWNAGLIISDANFYNSASMTSIDIQVFLNDKGASCTQPANTKTTTYAPCLKDLTATTSSIAATSYCAAYQGAKNETAAQIIAKVAQACAINPAVLLVTLQKEQRLVTRASVPVAAYAAATGANCPDTGSCSTKYAGFVKQVYRTGELFQYYKANATRYTYQAGKTVSILYSTKSSCGSSKVAIQNQATAALYIYTPYQPNAAALAAGWGEGNACSSYGNRNFWLLYTSWFGDPLATAKVSDTVAVADGTLLARGGKYYLVSGLKKVRFPSAAAVTNAGLKPSRATAASAGTARAYTTVASRMLTVTCSAKTYLVSNGKLLRISKTNAARYPWASVSLSAAACKTLTVSRTTIGKFIRTANGTRYIVIKGKKYKIATRALYIALRGSAIKAVTVSSYLASAIPTGKTVKTKAQVRALSR